MKNEYGIFITSEETAKYVIKTIVDCGSLVFPWTDGLGTQYDILVSLPVTEKGLLRGMNYSDLFIGIIGIGLWGFDIEGEKHSIYIAEKLNITIQSPTTLELTTLISLLLNELKK